ncbi:hypothetical protein ACFE04_008047 [Oxalis oulophora]
MKKGKKRSSTELKVTPEKAVKLCDRNFGVGADGVIFVMPGVDGTDYTMRIFNSDGSEPEMCGNGVRCFARFVADLENLQGRQSFTTVHTGAGLIILEILDDGKVIANRAAEILGHKRGGKLVLIWLDSVVKYSYISVTEIQLPDRKIYVHNATPEETKKEALKMINVYMKFAYEQAVIPIDVGQKTKLETFVGSHKTYTIEAMMGDRKALQAGTSHNLGQNFSRAFESLFTDENGQRQNVWQTSWVISSNGGFRSETGAIT